MSSDQTSPPKQYGFLGGCLRNCTCGCLTVFLILALPIWWFCFHTTPLRISEKTTYVISPLTSDGKRVDYFLALEELLYPPEEIMKSDDNGYRLIVRACGVEVAVNSCSPVPYTGENAPETFVLTPLHRQIYEKLGLDPPEAIFSDGEPTMKIESPIATEYLPKYDSEHPPAEGEESQTDKFLRVTSWTFDDFPMLKDWLDENSAGIDLLGEAVRKPVFFIPYVREHETSSFFDIFMHSRTTPYRGLANAVQARAYYRLGIGDIDGAIDDIMTMHLLARHVGKRGSLIYYRAAAAIESAAHSIDIASNPDFLPTKEQIEHFIVELDALPPRWTWRDVLESERYVVLGNLLSDYWGYNEPDSAGLLGLPGMRWMVDINIFMERVNEIYDAIIEETTIDGKTLEEFREWVKNPSGLPITIRSRSIFYANMGGFMFIEGIGSIRELEQHVESEFDATLEKLQTLLDSTATPLP